MRAVAVRRCSGRCLAGGDQRGRGRLRSPASTPADFLAAVTAATLLALHRHRALRGYRGQLGKAVRDLLAWVALALALVLGYSFREDFHAIGQRVTGELMPPGESVSVAASMPRRARGADPQTCRRPLHRPRDVNGACRDAGRHRRVDRRAQAGRRASGRASNVDSLSYTVPVQHRQRHHLRRRRPPAQADRRPHHRRRGRGARGEARCAQGEPARYEFLKASAII